MIWIRNDRPQQLPVSTPRLPPSVIAERTDSEIAGSTRRSVTIIASEGIRAGLVFGTSALGGTMAATLAPKIVDGATPEGIIGVGVGLAAAAGVGLGVALVRNAMAEVKSLVARLTRPSFDGDLASRSAHLLLAGAVAAPTALLAAIGGGDAMAALITAGFMGIVSAGVGGMATTVATNRALRDERNDALSYRVSSGVI